MLGELPNKLNIFRLIACISILKHIKIDIMFIFNKLNHLS